MTGLKSKSKIIVSWVMAGLLTAPIPVAATETEQGSFSMGIMDVFSISGKGVVLTGRINSGEIGVGDTVCVPLESGGQAAHEVLGLEMSRKLLKQASAGQNVGVLIDGIDKKAILKGGKLHDDCTLEVERQTDS